MEQNPEWRGKAPGFDEIQYIKYGTEDAAERALTLGEVDVITEVQPATFERLGDEPNVETIRGASPSYTELAFNLCSEQDCPDAEFNPAVQDQAVRQALAHTIDRERDQRDLRPGNLVRGQRHPAAVLPDVLRDAGAAL